MTFAFYNENRPVTGRSVLWWVISFFVIIFLANIAFVYFALSSWTGLSTENAYEKGVRYNETIARAEAQRKLGWQSTVDFDGDNLVVKLVGKDGNFISGRIVQVEIIRPVHEGLDQKLKLREAGQGIYQAPLKIPQSGRWWVDISVGKQYRMRHELQVK